MADASLHLNAKEYEKFMADHHDELVLTDFYADWCPHCQSVSPILENLAREYKPQGVHIVKIDTDVEEQLAAANGVEYLPTLILTRSGQELERASGSKPAEFFRAWFDKYIDTKAA